MKTIERNQTKFQVLDDTINKDFWNISNWEYWSYNEILKHVDCHTFVDVGAWIGPFTLFASQHFKNVVSFEPDNVAFSELSENVKLNGYTNVELNKHAISNHNGTLSLGVSTSPIGMSESSIFKLDNRFEVICKTLKSVYEERGLTTNTFLKIDVEGAEFNLFEDVEFFNKTRPVILVECHSPFMNAGQYCQLKCGFKMMSEFYDAISIGQGQPFNPNRELISHQLLIPHK